MGCLTPFHRKIVDKLTGEEISVLVPCGKCEDCLKKKQSDWISRLLLECQVSLSSFFITLTYDENHLPFPQGVNKRDVQLFFKRFRKHFSKSQKFTYFLCSEYGSISSRPHYHFLLFCRFDLEFIPLSYLLADSWDSGQHKIGTVDVSSIAYCSKYCLKSRVDVRHFYRNKTFALMSKRPAIGFDLFKIKDQFVERKCFEVVSGDRCVAMPRYYRDRMGFDEQDLLDHYYEIQQKQIQIHRDNPVTVMSEFDRISKRIAFERKQSTL